MELPAELWLNEILRHPPFKLNKYGVVWGVFGDPAAFLHARALRLTNRWFAAHVRLPGISRVRTCFWPAVRAYIESGWVPSLFALDWPQMARVSVADPDEAARAGIAAIQGEDPALLRLIVIHAGSWHVVWMLYAKDKEHMLRTIADLSVTYPRCETGFYEFERAQMDKWREAWRALLRRYGLQ